mgnify:CR=1 FL=1
MKFYNDRRYNLYYYRRIINFIKVIFYCIFYYKTIPNIFKFTSNLLKDFRKKNNDKANIFWDLIIVGKLTAIHNGFLMVRFYKNGRLHNTKNAACTDDYAYREFRLNGNWYSVNKNFTKESWRRFVKLQAFL